MPHKKQPKAGRVYFDSCSEDTFHSGRESVVMGMVLSCGCRNTKLCVCIRMAQETRQEVGLSSKPQGPPPREPLSPARPGLPMVLQLPKWCYQPDVNCSNTWETLYVQTVTASLLSSRRKDRGMATFYSSVLFGCFISLTNNFLSTKKCYSEGIYGKCYE